MTETYQIVLFTCVVIAATIALLGIAANVWLAFWRDFKDES